MIIHPSSSNVCMVSYIHRSVGPFLQPSTGPSNIAPQIPPLEVHLHPHYPFGQIPFLFPLRIFNTQVMTTLNLHNLTLGIPFWYLGPPSIPLPPSFPTPYLASNPMQLISTTPVSPKAHVQGPPQTKQIGKGVDKGGKEKNKGGTNTPEQSITT